MENVQPIGTTEDIVKFIEALQLASPKTAKWDFLLFKLVVSIGLRFGERA